MSTRTCALLLCGTLALAPPVAAEASGDGAGPSTSGVAASAARSVSAEPATGDRSAGGGESRPLEWMSDYRKAWDRAAEERKMLLIHFHASPPGAMAGKVAQTFQNDAAVRRKAAAFVRLELPVDATIRCKGKPVRLLDHAAFSALRGHAGLAIIELVDKKRTETYGRVVSAFPYSPGKYYRFRVEYLPVILDLPLGTITQRTMIWAVRTHPERPPSTQGTMDPTLIAEACKHCRYQARIGLQGHHHWETRFHRLRRLLGWRYTPVEVVAESWPGENLLDSCIDCVDSWRHSAGHWQQVASRHARYAYDIQRGSNGIWYGTGIFAN